jgi:hypothetical protein
MFHESSVLSSVLSPQRIDPEGTAAAEAPKHLQSRRRLLRGVSAMVAKGSDGRAARRGKVATLTAED